MTKYCEQDLVKRRLEIDVQDHTLDHKIDDCIEEASAIIENAMVSIGGVPSPVPGILAQACADIAAAVFKQSLQPLVENPLYQRGLDRIEDYKAHEVVTGIPFWVGTDES